LDQTPDTQAVTHDHSRGTRPAQNSKRGKRRLNFASFITKERLNFPAASRYHVDRITQVNLMTGKLSAQSWHIVKAVFHFLKRSHHGALTQLLILRL
jgi:hypothetical protein